METERNIFLELQIFGIFVLVLIVMHFLSLIVVAITSPRGLVLVRLRHALNIRYVEVHTGLEHCYRIWKFGINGPELFRARIQKCKKECSL